MNLTPYAGQPRRTVIIHGIRTTERSPKVVVAESLPEAERPLVELWGVTRCNVEYWKGELTDWDRWFDLHPVDEMGEWPGIKQKRPEAWAWYRQQTKPIYMQEHYASVPASVAFPLHDVRYAFRCIEDLVVGIERSRMFTCMVDLLIAFALLDGFERIVLNGIGVHNSLEHQQLHRGILYWMGVVRGLEMATHGRYQFLVHQPSTFAMPEKIYGYEAFGYDDLRRFRKELSQAQRRARGLPRRRRTEAVA